MQPRPDSATHQLLLRWLLLTVVITAALFVCWEQGLLGALYAADSSRLSWAITLVYGLVTLHCGLRVACMSRELNHARLAARDFRQRRHALAAQSDDVQAAAVTDSLPASVMKDYLGDVIRNRTPPGTEENTADTELLRYYESILKSPQEIGWIATDVMLKLGLLGTIVGFIFMLGSIADVEDFDVSAMQSILQLMSTGMGTALYTTLAGITCSLLAGLQYYMLDKGANQILDSMRYIRHAELTLNRVR